MSITVNTNMAALRIQTNLSSATDKMNTAMERMSSGSKINSAKDDAAGYAVSTKLKSTISSTAVAADNVAIGQDLLATADGVLSVVSENLSRIRDLTEQAANGTYTTEDLTAIAAEVSARLSEITSITTNATFNGKKLFEGTTGTAITIQSGTTSAETTVLDASIFAKVDVSSLSGLASAIKAGNSATISGNLTKLDALLTGTSSVTARQTDIGAAQNKLDAASNALSVQATNLTSALSTVRDADVAEESASYVQSQILQSASATLLVQANSAPQIALTLIKG